MANVRTAKKTVKVAPAAKKTVALKAKKTRTVAQKAETETVFSKPLEGVEKMTETVKDTVQKATAEVSEKATELFKDVNVRAKEVLEKGGEMAKDVVEFNKANLEAVVESGKIAAKGAQEAAQRAVEISRKNWEATTAHGKSLTSVKAPADFFQAQSAFVRKQFDVAVADFSKTTEFYLKLAGEVAAPIQNRYAVVVDQVKARMAA